MYLRNCINWNKKKKTPDSPYKYTDRQMDRYIYRYTCIKNKCKFQAFCII